MDDDRTAIALARFAASSVAVIARGLYDKRPIDDHSLTIIADALERERRQADAIDDGFFRALHDILMAGPGPRRDPTP